MKKIVLYVAVSSLVLTACANANSIFRTKELSAEGPSVVAVDARQRFVLTNHVDDENGEKHIRICAEQFPDIFTIIGSSLSASGSIIPGVSGARAEGQLSRTLQEAGSSIERTQTINILRESMYRTCERFLTGAISDVEFATQAARDNRTMVSVLAIEQLTGTLVRPSTILNFNGNTSAIGGSIEVQSELRTVETELVTAREEASAAEAALSTSLTDGTNECSELDGGPEGEAQQVCTAAQQMVSVTTQRVNDLEETQSMLRQAMVSLTTATLSGGGSTASDDSTRSYLDTPEAITEIARAVVEIVNLNTRPHLDTACEAIILNSMRSTGSDTEIGASNMQTLDNCFRYIERQREDTSIQFQAPPRIPLVEIDFVTAQNANLSRDNIINLVELLEDNIDQISVYRTPSLNEGAHPKKIEVTYYESEHMNKAIEVYRTIQRGASDALCLRKAGREDYLEIGFGEIDVFLPNNYSPDPNASSVSQRIMDC